VGTLAVDRVGVCLAAFGFLNPLLAAFIHVFRDGIHFEFGPASPPISSANPLSTALPRPNPTIGERVSPG